MGEYNDNFPNGIGTWKSANGYVYNGHFKNGYKHGKCIEETFPNGDTFVGFYDMGEIKEGSIKTKDE